MARQPHPKKVTDPSGQVWRVSRRWVPWRRRLKGTLDGLELLLLLLVLPFAILGRVLFGRHWTVELRGGWRPWWEAQAGDWQSTGIRIHEIADAVRRGNTPAAMLGDTAARPVC